MGRAQDRHPNRVYMGERTARGPVVCVAWTEGGRVLRARHRQSVVNHGNGLEWGYGGSGPAQLALEILTDALQDAFLAQRYHQVFKWEVVAKLPHHFWVLTRESVLEFVSAQLAKDAGNGGWSDDDTISLPNPELN